MELATFLVVFRESLEASLIVGIILTVLIRLSATRYIGHVMASFGAAVLTSIVLGWWAFFALERVTPFAKEILGGFVSIAACAVLTYMIFWMHQQSKKIRPDIEGKLQVAISKSEYRVIVMLPFLAVLREGAETVLFLKATALQTGGALSGFMGAIGFLSAVVIGLLLFVWGRRIPLKPLFQVTGFLLLFVSAGLLTYGIHELQEIGWIPEIIPHVWNLNGFLSDREGFGSFLKALFGYNGNPSLTEILGYGSYLTIAWMRLRSDPRAIESGKLSK